MTAQTSPAAARLAMDPDLLAARKAATDDYIERGLEAYRSRGALRSDLCLLIALANTAQRGVTLTLAELEGLIDSGLATRGADYSRTTLTQAGADAAAAAHIARAI